MHRLSGFRRAPRGFIFGLVLGLLVASAGVAAAGGLAGPKIMTPKYADKITNLDVLRLEIKNYYGTPAPPPARAATAGWTLPLNMDQQLRQGGRQGGQGRAPVPQ